MKTCWNELHKIIDFDKTIHREMKHAKTSQGTFCQFWRYQDGQSTVKKTVTL